MPRTSRVVTTSVDEPSKPSGLAKSLGSVAAVLTTTIAAKGLDAGWRAAFGEDSPSEKNLKAEDKRRTQNYKASKKLGEDPQKPRPAQDSEADWKLALFAGLSAAAIVGARVAATRGSDFLINRRPPLNRG